MSLSSCIHSQVKPSVMQAGYKDEKTPTLPQSFEPHSHTDIRAVSLTSWVPPPNVDLMLSAAFGPDWRLYVGAVSECAFAAINVKKLAFVCMHVRRVQLDMRVIGSVWLSICIWLSPSCGYSAALLFTHIRLRSHLRLPAKCCQPYSCV